jgi:hypothetical protein
MSNVNLNETGPARPPRRHRAFWRRSMQVFTRQVLEIVNRPNSTEWKPRCRHPDTALKGLKLVGAGPL